MLAPMKYPEMFPAEEEEYHPTAVGRTMFVYGVDDVVAGTILRHLEASDAAVRVAHLRVLRRIQEETGGFTEFVPLPFVHHSSPIYLAGVARPGPTLRDNRAVHALARILLHGAIDHVQTSWVKLGTDGTRAMLRAGADDLGGTLMEETISRMAGSMHGSAKTVAELREMGEGIGRPVRQRTTTYGIPAVHADAEPAAV